MQILFIMMTPLQSNTSAIMRMSGIIKGASLNGHVCDLITLQGNKNDSHYDSYNNGLEEKYIRDYYKISTKKLYSAFKTSRTEMVVKHKCFNPKKIVRNFVLGALKTFTIYEGTDVNAKRIKELDIDFNRYDRIVSVSDPKSSHKMVLELLKAGRISNIRNKWIQCWGDPWVSDMTKRYGIKKPLIQKEEAYILDLAKKVVYTSPFTLDEQKNIYKNNAAKMVLVNQTVLECYEEEQSDNHSKTLGYFGAYMDNIRNIMPLYECCKTQNYDLIIAGKTDLKLQNTKSIKLYRNMSLSEVNQLEKDVGVIVCLCNRFGTQIPGKIYYQAAFQKPIIIIIDGENRDRMKKYFEGFDRYIICDNNKRAIKQAIEQAYKEIDYNKHYDFDERFSPEFCAEKILL